MPLYFCIFNKKKFDFIFLESVSAFELFSFILSPKSNLWSAPNECAKSIGKQTTHIASGTKAHSPTLANTHTQAHTYVCTYMHTFSWSLVRQVVCRSNPFCILRPRHGLTSFTEFRTASISSTYICRYLHAFIWDTQDMEATWSKLCTIKV